MRYNVGDVVHVTGFDPAFNDKAGVIVSINGEYHNVSMIGEGIQPLLQLYRSEIMLTSEYWENMYPTIEFRNTGHFDEELFTL
jgi:hypothetical protein